MTNLSKILSPYLPPEIIFNILLRLPSKALIRFMCVCRAWSATIHNEKFIKAHHELMKTNTPLALVLIPKGRHDQSRDFLVSISFDGDVLGNNAVRIPLPLEVKQPGNVTRIVNCCNGLVWISMHSIYNAVSTEPDFALWNPTIQRLKRISFTSFKPPKISSVVYRTCGFGYDSTNDDYKLVTAKIYTDQTYDRMDSEVKIYSLKSNSWKQIQDLPYKPTPSCFINYRSYVNGSLHWLTDPNLILTLDLTTEKYDTFPTPEVVDAKPSTLGVLGGFLYLYFVGKQLHYLHDVWIMKEYGVTASWTRLYTIDAREMPGTYMPEFLFHHWEPFVLSNTGKLVLLVSDKYKFCWYDMEKKSAKEVDILGIPREFTTAIFAENLYLLNGVPVIIDQ